MIYRNIYLTMAKYISQKQESSIKQKNYFAIISINTRLNGWMSSFLRMDTQIILCEIFKV